MGLAKTAAAAVNLLIHIGYFPVHVNLDLLKFSIRTDFPDKILSAAEKLLLESPDPDKVYICFLFQAIMLNIMIMNLRY